MMEWDGHMFIENINYEYACIVTCITKLQASAY